MASDISQRLHAEFKPLTIRLNHYSDLTRNATYFYELTGISDGYYLTGEGVQLRLDAELTGGYTSNLRGCFKQRYRHPSVKILELRRRHSEG